MGIKDKLKFLKANEHNIYVIHYSCENLNDNNENISPRVTSIAVLHLQSHTMHSFSIHLVAEKAHIGRDEIADNYNDLEKQMLADFYSFVRDNNGALWLHWNMSNINYGFEALSHRYEVLSGEKGVRIQDSSKHNLSSLIIEKYGKDSIAHPRMKTLQNLNDGNHRDSLSGEEEVKAFQDKEFVRLHKSTMSKAYWFQSMYFLLQKGKIKVSNYNLSQKLNNQMEKPWVKLLSFIAVIFTLVQAGQLAYAQFNDPQADEVIKAEQPVGKP
ncbi:hypothetical protein [Shewanella psychrotolerans]|uniref:hypothetical protein n=1 Tax=Shewanella psychrotolerans TaxID=2864206 RepID=UPI001C6571D5|nr:hypothetical protein [Shewanella psychrotolerans]EJL6615593.1 hypothetical protein [Vibrio cholerae]QYK01059.1 hypothetical protein K0I62_17030 [Shewanella psychrotolerans]